LPAVWGGGGLVGAFHVYKGFALAVINNLGETDSAFKEDRKTMARAMGDRTG